MLNFLILLNVIIYIIKNFFFSNIQFNRILIFHSTYAKLNRQYTYIHIYIYIYKSVYKKVKDKFYVINKKKQKSLIINMNLKILELFFLVEYHFYSIYLIYICSHLF